MIAKGLSVNQLVGFLAQTDGPPKAPAFQQGSYFFPVQASSFAKDSDWLYYFIFWVCAVFFAGIVGAMVYLVIKYRRRPGVDPENKVIQPVGVRRKRRRLDREEIRPLLKCRCLRRAVGLCQKSN